jgi:ankyrin repeat protein
MERTPPKKSDTRESKSDVVKSTGADSVDDKAAKLFRAAHEGQIDVVEFLLMKGEDVNAKTKNGRTALILAVAKGHPEIVGMLLTHGADVNAKTENGLTALKIAERKGHTEIARLIRESGAKE